MITCTEAEMESSMFGPEGPLMICTNPDCDDRENVAMESDAYNYKCHSCNRMTWCSAEELLIRGQIEIAEEEA